MSSCAGCGTHTGTHWPDCPFGDQPNYSSNELSKQTKRVIEAISDSQAHLQVAIGVLRLRLQEIDLPDSDLILDKMYSSLGDQHRLLKSLGKDMYITEDRPESYTKKTIS